VLGDEIYGSDRHLRMDLERRKQPFVLAIRSNEKLWSVLEERHGQHAATELTQALPGIAPAEWTVEGLAGYAVFIAACISVS
jgi:hypothetical protein